MASLKRKFKEMATGKPHVPVVKNICEQLGEMGCVQGMGDLWDEARMSEVLVYLRGNTNLSLPDWARPLLPKDL